ncbi:MAG: elongation factor P [Candidatus Scalindua sediminis]|nr:elongation factor P [Candidatus Scalindua sediminis]HDY67832.1 elongation factor P [Candidatus Scalindua sp.]
MINATDIRKGLIIKIDGELFSVSDFQHVTPGKGRAHMQVSIKSLKQGNVTQKRFRSTDKVEDVFLEHIDMEYLYKDGEDFCFMNTENYEQVLLTKEVLGDTMLYITPNSKVKVSFYEGNAVGIELPASVTLKIIETDPGTKGDTVTNVFKPAKLETGHIIKVPPFINPGELVKVDTRTGQFLGRA